jgi:hypothetical protein
MIATLELEARRTLAAECHRPPLKCVCVIGCHNFKVRGAGNCGYYHFYKFNLEYLASSADRWKTGNCGLFLYA